MMRYVREAVRHKRRQFHIGLDPPVMVKPLDGRGEVRGRRGGVADPLRWGIGEHGSCAACGRRGGGRWTVDDGRRNARADVIEVIIEVVNEGKGRSFVRSFLVSLGSFFKMGS